jgi:TATA-box binding protein (TBP) (component of TFIID and TFIIIB)
MKNVITPTKKVTNNIISVINLDIIPDDVSISTITLNAIFDTNFKCENIGECIELSKDNVLSVQYRDKKEHNRSLLTPKKKKKKPDEKKPTKCFYNQTTIVIKPDNSNPLNMKLFKNGSIQLTGCKNAEDFINVIEKICSILKKKHAVISSKSPNLIVNKPFVTNTDIMNISNLRNITIRMINSNFKIGFEINREELYNILLDDFIECSFEPIVHACVSVKYNYKDEKKISIFIFESGSVIITGATKSIHILEAYRFISLRLYANYSKIVNLTYEKCKDFGCETCYVPIIKS